MVEPQKTQKKYDCYLFKHKEHKDFFKIIENIFKVHKDVNSSKIFITKIIAIFDYMLNLEPDLMDPDVKSGGSGRRIKLPKFLLF